MPCALADPSGRPLAIGMLHTRYRESGLQWMVAGIDRLSFDPDLGRVCVLRGADDAPEARSA